MCCNESFLLASSIIMSSFSQKRGPLRWILIQVGIHPVQQDHMLNRSVAQWWTKATGFSFTFQDINHGLMLLSLSVHALHFFFPFCSVFGRKTCFVFHYFFVYRLHHTSGRRDSVVQLGESVLSIIIFTSNEAATFRVTILFRKGRYIRIKRCHKKSLH